MSGEELPLSFRFIPRRCHLELFELLRQAPAYYSKVYQRPPAVIDAIEVLHKLPPNFSFNSKMSIGVYWENSLLSVVDSIRGYPLPHICFIGLLLVSERCKRCGLGAQVVKTLELNFLSLNKTVMRLAVVASNPGAKIFWLKQGFRVKSTKYTDAFLAPVMVLEKTL